MLRTFYDEGRGYPVNPVDANGNDYTTIINALLADKQATYDAAETQYLSSLQIFKDYWKIEDFETDWFATMQIISRLEGLLGNDVNKSGAGRNLLEVNYQEVTFFEPLVLG